MFASERDGSGDTPSRKKGNTFRCRMRRSAARRADPALECGARQKKQINNQQQKQAASAFVASRQRRAHTDLQTAGSPASLITVVPTADCASCNTILQYRTRVRTRVRRSDKPKNTTAQQTCTRVHVYYLARFRSTRVRTRVLCGSTSYW